MARDREIITLKEAASELGVHPSTLRRWSNRGEILVMVTPGGHRRFPRSEIDRLKGQSTVSGSNRLSATLASTALTRTRSEIAHRQDERWISVLDEKEKEENRLLGRRLMGLLMQFVSDSGHDEDALLEEARGIGRVYAVGTKKAGLTLAEVIETMMFFRDNIVESALLLPNAIHVKPDANRILLRRINTFLNAVLLSVAEAFEKPGPALPPHPGS